MVLTDPRSDKRLDHASVQALRPARSDETADQTGRVIPLRDLLGHGRRKPVAPEPAREVVPRAATGPQDPESEADHLPDDP